MKKIFTLAAAVLFSIGMMAETYQLISDGGELNSKDFYTTITTVNSASADFVEADESVTTWGYNITFGSSRSTAYGQTSNLIEYSAKSTQTRVKIYTKADNTGRKVLLQQFVEGAVPSSDPGITETYNLGAKDACEIFTYSSNNSTARTLYFMGNNGSIKICQIVIEEIGTPILQGGQIGYATLLKNGRHAVKSGVAGTIDGITYNVKSDLKPGNGGKGAVMRGATNYMKFTTTETVVFKAVEINKKGYYLAQTQETYDDSKAVKTGNAEFVLRTPGDWYVICNTSSDTQIDSIAFEAYVQSDDATLSAVTVGENALNMSQFVENEGVLEYDYELSYGTTEVPAVTYTTNNAYASVEKTDAADVNGSTILVVTAENGTDTQIYKINFSVKSSLGTDATLSSIKLNGVDIEGFAADVVEYDVEIGVYAALPTITYTLSDPNASAEYTAATEVPGTATIVVTPEDPTAAEKTYTINFTRAAATELVSISTSTTWDWAKAGSATPEQSATTLPTNAEEFNFADVLINPNAEFNAAALKGIAQFANRGGYFQGYEVTFNTTVAGSVVVTYSNTGGSRPYRHVEVNGVLSAAGSADQTMKDTEAFDVEAGNVVIKFYIPDAEAPQARQGDVVGYAMGRISKIVFEKATGTALDNTDAAVKAVKFFQNGQLMIEKNGVIYNAQGAVVR